MTMEAITRREQQNIMHHVVINFILNGEMRFMQFDLQEKVQIQKMFSCLWRTMQFTAADDAAAGKKLVL